MEIKYDFYADHIWKSKNGNLYINEDLKHKKTITTSVQLQRIKHNNSENDTICLKVGRYKFDGEPECLEPKSELTLDNEELANLIKFLEKYFGPMKTGATSFISTDNEHLSELLIKFKTITTSNSDKIKALLDSGIIDNDITLAIENSKRVNSLKEFCNSLENNLVEHYWQNWFESNKWVLGSEFLKILDDRRIDTENIADYLMESNDGFLDVVEIKRPNILLWSDSRDHGNIIPSSDLTKAIIQCQNYLYNIEREIDSKKFSERVDNVPIARPTCMLIIGRSKDWTEEQHLALRLLNSSLNRITVVTYDQLYTRAANIVGLLQSE